MNRYSDAAPAITNTSSSSRTARTAAAPYQVITHRGQSLVDTSSSSDGLQAAPGAAQVPRRLAIMNDQAASSNVPPNLGGGASFQPPPRVEGAGRGRPEDIIIRGGPSGPHPNQTASEGDRGLVLQQYNQQLNQRMDVTVVGADQAVVAEAQAAVAEAQLAATGAEFQAQAAVAQHREVARESIAAGIPDATIAV